ncbi:hypothetical protein J437_LFUL018265 [Ladona fulva]|uniref:MYND-type domain-containing protein n=1 Tax=Ladona fulva TaxID=123851 RepID=A0A8K0KMY6_LADFU|nr:hypothetical protein J437_LFUL018265 [Ladona fulva]
MDTSSISKSEADVKKEENEKEMEEKKVEEEDKKGDVEEEKVKEGKVEEEKAKEEKVEEEKAKEERAEGEKIEEKRPEEEKVEEEKAEEEKIEEEKAKEEKDEEEKVEKDKVEKEEAKKGMDEEDKVEKEKEIISEDEANDEERVEEAKEDIQSKEDGESRSLSEDIPESMEEDSQESVASNEEAEMVVEAKEKEGDEVEDEVEDEKKESEMPEKLNDEESQESVLDETSKLDEKDQEISSEIKDGKDEEVEDKDENEFKKPPLEEDSMSSSDAGKLGKDSEESQEASGPGSVKSIQQIEENSILGDSKDSCGRLWANMPVDDDFRLSLSGNFSREILSDSLDNFNCEASFFVQSSTKQDEPAAKSIDEAKLDGEVEKSKITEEEGKKKDSEEEKAEENGDDYEVSGEKRTEVVDNSEKMEVETKGKDSDEIGVKDGADKAVEESKNTSISSEKIDVNKLRVSLMTKCGASSPSGPRDSPGLALPEKEAVLANALHPETGALIAVDDASDKVPVEEEIPKEDTSPIVKESPKALVAAPINNKGDVGSQLSILGKLQQRLSFAKEDSDNEEVQEKDENTVDETESVAGDASSSSSEHEDEEDSAKKASKTDDKIEEIPSKEDEEAVKKITKDSVEPAASAETENVNKDVDKVPKVVEEAVLKTAESQEATEEKKDDESEKVISEKKCDETEKVISEKEPEKEKEKAEDKVVEASSDDTANEDTSKTTEVAMEEQPIPENVCKRVESNDSTDKSDSTQDNGMDLPSSKEGTSEKETIGSESGKKASKAKTKPSDSRSSEEDGPSIPKRQRLSDEKNKVGTIQVKSKAALMGLKVENAVEEGVLSREVLKESNMVVVSKVVKSKRLEEEALAPPPAPKRARKGVAHKALIVDRSDSPGQDEVFPSMFLDPSVTITVLQESENDNGESKECPSNPPSSVVEELRTSVNLSNDVSLTMVRPTAPLEGLAAAQDVAFSRNTEQNSVDIVGVPTTSPMPGTSPTFRPRARKSFPRPSQRISSRSPQPLAHGSSNADIKRLAQAVNGRDMSMAAMNAASPHSRTLPGTLPSPVSTRVASSQPSLPTTSLAFSSSPTLSTASTSQPLVHSMVSQVMPPSTVMVTSTQASSPSTSSARMPNLHPRPPSFPLSGPQPIYAPAEAGPVSAEFGKHAYKLASYMRGAIEEILGDLSRMGNSEAALKLLRLEIEKLKWEHQQEVSELKHNHDLMIVEMRNSLEKEKVRCVNEVRRHCEAEKMRAIEETKRKQWCANCSKEALFYCCWNTSYCDYPCQQSHWPRHMASCAQNNVALNDNGEGDAASNRKDGGTSGHKGLPSSAAPPPFHQLHRPGGSTQQESLPEEEYYDEDSNSPSAPRMGTSGGTYRVKRRRCGLCKGCLVKNNCGNCAPCRNSKTHQVCRMRRCRSLQSDWTPGGGGTSRPITPEPSLSVSLKTPPLTYASKERKARKVVMKTS